MKILSPNRFVRSIASKDLGIGIRVSDDSGIPPHEDDETLSFATIQSFKGLEADVVILVDVDDLEKSRMRSLMYVGASRARTLLATLRSESTTGIFARRVVEHSKRESAKGSELSFDLP